jgi:NitT/TauT family transport system substrate-binding protein
MDQKAWKTAFILLALFWSGLTLGRASHVSAEEIFVAYPSIAIGIAPFLIANAKGYYDAEDLKITMVRMPGATSVRAVMGGSVSFNTSLGSSLEAIVRGPDLKVLMVQGDKPLYDLFGLPSIRSMNDLKGKKVGVGAFGGSDDVVTRTILTKHGLVPGKDVILLQGGTPEVRFTAMAAGSIDASAFPPPLNLKAMEQGFVKLAFAGDYMNSLYGGIIATPRLISRSPELVLKFVRATLKGLIFLGEKREESIAIMSTGLKLGDKNIAGKMYDYVRPTLTRDGTIPAKLMDLVIEERRQAAGVTRPLDAKDVFEFSVIRQAMAELKAASWTP